MLRLLSYLLQTLSGDQAFANALNQTLRLSVPAKWAVQGTLADFMIVVSTDRSRVGTALTEVNLLNSYHARPQPSLPRLDDKRRQRSTLPAERRRPGVYTSSAAVQGVLGS